MKSNMIADDPAQTFRRLYEAKNPRAIDPDDDRAIPADDDDQQNAASTAWAMIATAAGADERPDDPEEPFVRVAAHDAARRSDAPAQGYRFVERDDDSDDDTDDDLARRMRFSAQRARPAIGSPAQGVQARARRSGPRGGRLLRGSLSRTAPALDTGPRCRRDLPDAVPRPRGHAADRRRRRGVTAFRERTSATPTSTTGGWRATVRAEVAHAHQIAR